MRVAVVSPFVDRQHGTERALAELLVRMARKGWEVFLYSQRVENLPKFDQTTNPSIGRIECRRIPRIPGPQLVQFMAWLVLNKLWRSWDRYARGIRTDITLSPGINCFDADAIIVHAIFHRLQEVASQEPKRAAGVRIGFFRAWHRRLYYRLLVFLERKIYSRPSVALMAVSQRTAGLLRKCFGRQNVLVLRNAADLQTFSPQARLQRREAARLALGFSSDEFVLLLVGNDWRVKGLPGLLEAAARCKGLPVHALVVGSEDQRPYLRLAQRLCIPDRLHFMSPQRDVMAFYAAADCYASPTREDACALPPIEAMACGLPVITTVENGGHEIITNEVDGFVLPDPLDTAALAETLLRLARDPRLRSEIGGRAVQTAQQYTWERNAAEGISFLESVVAGKNAHG